MRPLQTTDANHPSSQQDGTNPPRPPLQATTKVAEPTDHFVAPSDRLHMLTTTQSRPGVSPTLPALRSGLARTQPPLAHQRWLAWVNEQGISADESVERRELSSKLERKPAFTCNKIHIAGSLNLSNNTSLTSLPEGLSVDGDLKLNHCTSLTRLPVGLSIGGALELGNCISLTILPEGLRVGGYLNLNNCTGLTSLPDDLTVGSSLWLINCTSLTSLPNGLSVGGFLGLTNCTSLISLPEKSLSVGGGLTLSNCINLTSFSEVLEIHGRLILCECPSLTKGPNELVIIRQSIIFQLVDELGMPKKLSILGDLDLSAYLNIIHQLEELVVTGDLIASQPNPSTAAVVFPKVVSVSGSVTLSDFYISPTKLPETLNVGKDLAIIDCIGISALPSDIRIGGTLRLRNTSIQDLPRRFSLSRTRLEIGEGNNLFILQLEMLPNMRAKPWDSLAEDPLTQEHQKEQCGISSLPYAKLSDPVILLDTPGLVYSYEQLWKKYQNKGNLPGRAEHLDWDLVRRLPPASSSDTNH